MLFRHYYFSIKHSDSSTLIKHLNKKSQWYELMVQDLEKGQQKIKGTRLVGSKTGYDIVTVKECRQVVVVLIILTCASGRIGIHVREPMEECSDVNPGNILDVGPISLLICEQWAYVKSTQLTRGLTEPCEHRVKYFCLSVSTAYVILPCIVDKHVNSYSTAYTFF